MANVDRRLARADARGQRPTGSPVLQGTVALLDHDPDLGRALSGEARARARLMLRVNAFAVPYGERIPASLLARDSVAIFIVDGILARETRVGEHPTTELLGPGDVLRSGDTEDPGELLARSVEWNVVTDCVLAPVTHAVIARAAEFPPVIGALLERVLVRAERLAVAHAITQEVRIDDRLLALLWSLAERWGRVTSNGIQLPLRLPHRTLAGMVGARRPSVTTALGQLIERGAVNRRDDGTWLLLGDPPALSHAPAAAYA